MTVGIFDLDGFKAYNDTLRPSGRRCPARAARQPARSGGRRSRQRLPDRRRRIRRRHRARPTARAAQGRAGRAQRARCSVSRSAARVGSTRILAGITLEQALHVADQRLYANKRSGTGATPAPRSRTRSCRCSPSRTRTSSTHLGHVADARLAAPRSPRPARPSRSTLARLAAELHDIGKAAIPASILDKPGPLDRERAQRSCSATARSASASSRPPRRSTRDRADRPRGPRARRRHRLPRRPPARPDPDLLPHHRRRRRLRRDDHRPPLPQARSPREALAELRRHAGNAVRPAVVEAFAAAATAEIEAATAA